MKMRSEHRTWLLGMLAAMVLTIAPRTKGTVLDIVTYDVGLSGGRLGGAWDALIAGNSVGVSVVIDWNPYPGYTYDGYLVKNADLDLHCNGPGSLSIEFANSGFETLILEDPPIDENGNIPRLQASGKLVGAGGQVIKGLLYYSSDGPGATLLDLTLYGLSEYSPVPLAMYNCRGSIGRLCANIETAKSVQSEHHKKTARKSL